MPKVRYGKTGKMKKMPYNNGGGRGGFKGNAMSRSAMAADKGKSTMKRTPMGKV